MTSLSILQEYQLNELGIERDEKEEGKKNGWVLYQVLEGLEAKE